MRGKETAWVPEDFLLPRLLWPFGSMRYVSFFFIHKLKLTSITSNKKQLGQNEVLGYNYATRMSKRKFQPMRIPEVPQDQSAHSKGTHLPLSLCLYWSSHWRRGCNPPFIINWVLLGRWVKKVEEVSVQFVHLMKHKHKFCFVLGTMATGGIQRKENHPDIYKHTE